MSIERFFIIANRGKDSKQELSRQICEFLKSKGKACEIAFTEVERQNMRGKLRGNLDCLLVLGGDGTVLEAAHLAADTGTPILGINIGNVGYLAEVEVQNWEQALRRVLVGSYEIENRMMLDGFVTDSNRYPYPGAFGHALNDIVITRKGLSRIISLRIYVNEELVDDYRGDGVIISTPTGSTAYNLSAGGPIITPKADVMVITPICPHSLSPRSVVVSSEDIVKVVVRKSKKTQSDEAIATFDGQTVIDLGTDDEILIKKAQYNTRLIRLNRTVMYEVLRSKLTGGSEL